MLGFQLFNKDKLPIWKVGYTGSVFSNVKTVELADGEVIVGVVVKLHPVFWSVYTDLQFQIAGLK